MSEQPIDRVRKLISNYKNSTIHATPAQICRHVALQLGIAEAEAAELIQRAALEDLAQKHRFRPQL